MEGGQLSGRHVWRSFYLHERVLWIQFNIFMITVIYDKSVDK